MLDKLRNFDAERNTDVDEMVALSAFARGLAAEYTTLALDAPEWLETQQKAVANEINSRLADMRAKRIREVRARLATLKTAEEKRAELNAELERLEAAK